MYYTTNLSTNQELIWTIFREEESRARQLQMQDTIILEMAELGEFNAARAGRSRCVLHASKLFGGFAGV